MFLDWGWKGVVGGLSCVPAGKDHNCVRKGSFLAIV